MPPASAPCSSVRPLDRKSTRLNSSHLGISYAVFCLKKKKKTNITRITVKTLSKKTYATNIVRGLSQNSQLHDSNVNRLETTLSDHECTWINTAESGGV